MLIGPVNFGAALLHVRGDALAEVVGAQQRQQLEEHVVHVLVERLGLGGAHHPLDRPHGERRVGGDLAGQLAHGLLEVLGLDHVVHQAELERLRRR